MPRPRYDNIDPAKKTRLLTAAMREFGARGYELASINRILEEAGLSKGSFYYYFDDKADLAATVFIAAAEPEALLSELRAPASAEAFWAELRRINVLRLKELESRRLEYTCVSKLAHAFASEPKFAAQVLPRFAATKQKMSAFLEQGLAVGALRTDLPLPTFMALMESIKTTAWSATFPDGHVPTDEAMEAFADLMIDLARRIAHPKPPQERTAP